MKKLLLFIALVFGTIMTYGQQSSPPLKSVRSAAPKIDKSDIVVETPDRYYYFSDNGSQYGEEKLHCYYPESGVDVTLDLDRLQGFYSFVEAAWYDAKNDNAYIALMDGGTELCEVTIYKISPKNYVSEAMTVGGMRPCSLNDYRSDDLCGVDVHNQCVKIKGIDVNSYYSLDLKPIYLPAPEYVKLSLPNIGFVKVNTDGVNIRREPSAKAPRLVRYKYSDWESAIDNDSFLAWEDKSRRQQFSPYHPVKDEILYYNKSAYSSPGWHPVMNEGYVSAKYVDEVTPEKITVDRRISEELKDDIRFIENGKYAGLCLYMYHDDFTEMGNTIFFGKIVDGIVVFYGSCFAPSLDFNENFKGLKKEDGTLYFGGDYKLPDDYSIDLCKLTSADIDLLMKEAVPMEYVTDILVGFPGKEMLFDLKY